MSITEPSRIGIALTLLASRIARRRRYEGFVEGIGLHGNEMVLDFGAGWGDISYFIAARLNKGGRVTALDVSKEWQEVARKRLRMFQNIDYVNADVRSDGLTDASYDVIVINYVLHDIPKNERATTVKELAKKLKPAGFIELREPIGKHHGIQPVEVASLMEGAHLKESAHVVNRKEIRARYFKT
jgi:ubiquinone/menaquinone biosynthesis C-methylase UbiE